MNNYYRKDAMASSCKQIFYREDKRERRCNRFTHKKHFKNITELVRLVSLILSLIGHQNNMFVHGMLMDSSEFKTEIYSESAITHMPQILVGTQIYADKEEPLNKFNKILIPTPDNDAKKIQFLKESYKNTKYEEIGNKNINITLSIDENERIKDLSVLNFTAASSMDTTKNLNIEQLETLATLKNRSELSRKPEIRNQLSTDIISLENVEKYISGNTYLNKEFHEPKLVLETKNEQLESYSDGEQIDNNITKANDTQEHQLRNYEQDKFQPNQHIRVNNYETKYQAEPTKNIFDRQKYNKSFAIAADNLPHNYGDSVTEVNATKFKVDITENNNNKTLNSVSKTQSMVDHSVIFNHTNLVTSKSEMSDDFPNTITETYPSLSLDSIDFVTQNYSNNYNDNILSVDLHETISSDPSNTNETDALSMEEYPKSLFEQMTEETGNANNSCVDEEFEHVVIKKVLVQKEIFDDPYVATTYPVLENDDKNLLQLTYPDQSAQENKSEKKSSDTLYSFKNYTLDMETLNERIKSDVLESENITNFISIENSETIITTTDINEYYQSTEAIEQYENNVVKYGSEQNPQHYNSINRSKNISNTADNITDSVENEVDEILWTSGEERILNKLHYEEPTKQEADKYNQSIGIAEKFKNNIYIIKKNQNKQLIINENYETNNEKHANQEDTLKNLKNILESEIQDTNNNIYATEKYQNNYNTSGIIVNEQKVKSDLAEPVKGSSSVSRHPIPLSLDDIAATLFETYPPQDVGQMFNDNLADESAGVGKALPVSITEHFNRSTIIIVISSATAVLFIVISITIFLISFQRQHGTLDIEMQERNCGKDDLHDEDAQTFAKLLQVELPPLVAVALDECEECL